MSRAGYGDDEDFPGQHGLYRGTVRRAIRGKRGQAFLRELADALDAMPVKELVARTVVRQSECCALGAVALRRGLDLSPIAYDDPEGEEIDGDWTTEWLRDELGIVDCLAREVVYENDECGAWNETPADRWRRVRAWVASHLRDAAPAAGGVS